MDTLQEDFRLQQRWTPKDSKRGLLCRFQVLGEEGSDHVILLQWIQTRHKGPDLSSQTDPGFV